jgi:hypothetical protein
MLKKKFNTGDKIHYKNKTLHKCNLKKITRSKIKLAYFAGDKINAYFPLILLP